jgi:Zn-finger nucleic acid-binding protein
MKCPACSNQLSVKTVSGIDLDVCDNGCGGIWFDKFEFKKFDERQEPDVETLLHLTIKSRPQNTGSNLDCPKCAGIKMMRHFSSVKRLVTMDECPKCSGVWLDAGELTAIRNEFATEDERRKAAEKVFSEMFDAALDQQRKESSEKAAKAHQFAHALRFICPSYFTSQTTKR